MKKIILFMLISICIISGLYSAVGRQDAQYNYTTLTAGTTNYMVTVSSSSVTTIAYTNELKGVQRTLYVDDDTLKVKYQVGNSSTTVLTNGITLEPRIYVVQDTSMAPIYLQAPSGSASVLVAVDKIEKV